MNVNCTTTVPRSNYYSILKKRKCSYKENVTVKLKRQSTAVESEHSAGGENKYPKSDHSMCVICRTRGEDMINRRYDDSLRTQRGKPEQEEQQHYLQSKQQNDIKHRQSCRNVLVKTSSAMPSSVPSPPPPTTTTTTISTTKWDSLQIANQQSQSEWNATGVRSSCCNSSHRCSRNCSMPSCQLQSTSHLSTPDTPSLSTSSPSLSPSSIGALLLSSPYSPFLPKSSTLPPPPPLVVPPQHPPTPSATCSLSLLRPSFEAVASEISRSPLWSGLSQSSSRTNAMLSGSNSLSFRGDSRSNNASSSRTGVPSTSLSSSSKYCANALSNVRVTNVSVLRTFALVTVMLEKCFIGLFGTRQQRIPSENKIDKQMKTCRQSKQSNTSSFSLPKFPLIFTVLVLSLMTLMLPTSVDAEVRLQRKEHVCKSKDIRNSPGEFEQLTDCTVIEGFLLITLIDANSSEYQKHSFPLLTEVTEFVMVYHVNGLRTLSTMFPNLSVIRGKNLFEGYALVLYENRHLEDVGLPSLITIARGAVRIEKNPDMCFVNTIDWSEIAVNMTNDQHFFRENKAKKECPLCPGDRERDSDRNEMNVSCPVHQGKRHCWNSRICQKICPSACKNNCNDDLQCCDDACIGGCHKSNKSSCSSCRHLANTTVCMDKCPANFFSYQDRRCITAETCTNVIGMKLEGTKPEYLVAFNGTCSVHCPPGHNKVGTTCKKCEGKCEKKCEGRLIDSVGAARQLHGCTHIYGSALTISIKQGGRHLMEELEMGLSSIEVIDTYLKVHRTYGLTSLAFFKNLRVIKGQILESEKFVLYVLENQDLESIWGKNQTVKMEEGRVFFHFNPKLCFSVIDSIRPSLKNTSDFDKNEVAQDSNGSKGSCNTEVLKVEVQSITSSSAYVVIKNPMIFDDDRVFIGYQFFHTVDPYGNVSMFGHKPCDDKWSSEDPSKEETHYFSDLKPFTQYAFYVKTQTISSERRNGQSQIMRFRTKPDQPKSVQYLMAYSNSSSEIVVNWQRPSVTNGNLTKYIITATLDTKDPEKLTTRNYCLEPLKDVETVEPPWTTVEKPTSDCVCEKNVTRKEGTMPLEEEEFLVNAIDFENNIQNFVYVKQTNDQPNETLPDTRRRRRAIDFSSAILDRVTRSSFQSILMNSQNISKMDVFGNYYEHFVETVNVSQFKKEEFVLKKLKHFSSYTIIVKACRAPEEGATSNECSPESRTVVRTQKLSDVDIVRNLYVKLEQSNTTRGNLRVKWDPPERPNSLVVSYTIFYVAANSPDAVREKRCITEPDYQQNFTNGYLLTGLSTGNYSVQVRANSLAGEGIKSEPVYINIPPHRVSAQTITLIIVILLILCIIIGFVVYYVRKKFMAPPTDLKIFPTVNPYYISMQYLPDEWEVPREKIIQLGALGQGSFGMVYEGILKNFNNEEDTPCAIKTVNENATDRERLNFLKEASVMKQFNTHHVVRLLGVCSRGQPAFVIMELMKNGDLKAYLRQHRPDAEPLEPGKPPLRPPTLGRILQIAIEIADGMAYLAAKKFVHRDLAARNCMVAQDLTVKIGDFGMTRDIYETDYYRKGTKGLLPVRWMAPESLKDGVFSSASDVFSYGVVLWEMATLASQPYQGLANDQVLHFVIDGGVMARPDNCPDKLYKLMQKCWEHRPSARPSFMEIIRYLLDSADPKFQEVSFYHSAEAKDILDQMHEHDLDDVTTPLRADEFEYKLNIDDNSSVGQHDSPALDEEDEDDDDEIVQPHSPYSLGSAIMINSSTPGGHSKNSSNIKINQSNPSLSLPSTSAAAIAASIATSTTENVVYVQPDPLYQYNNDHKQTEQNENCKFIEDDKTNPVHNSPPAKKAIKNRLSSNTSIYPNSLKRAVVSTVQNVSNSLVPLRLTNMNFLHHRLFKNNSNSSSSGGKGEKNNINTKSDTTNSNNGNNNSSNTMTANAETGSTGSRSFFSALTPSHTSKNPNYQILYESIAIAPDEQYTLDESQQPIESPQQARLSSGGNENINENEGNNAVKQKQQLNKTTEQCNLSRDSTNLGSNNKFKDTKPSQSSKQIQPTNTLKAHELSSSAGVSSPIRIKDNRNKSNTPAVISTSNPLTTKSPYQLKENWLKQLPQMPPPNGFIGREG